MQTRSWRERYTALAEAGIPPRGNLLVLTLPGVEMFRNDEFAALDKWVRRGNTLLINAALLDQPGWAVGRESGVVTEVESLTVDRVRDARRRARHVSTTRRSRSACARPMQREAKKDEDEDGRRVRASSTFEGLRSAGEDRAHGHRARMHCSPACKTLALETDYEPEEWSLRMPYDNFVLTLARGANGEGALFEQRLGRGPHPAGRGRHAVHQSRAGQRRQCAADRQHRERRRVARDGVVLFDDLRQGLSASYDPARFYRDSRLYTTMFILLAAWLVWVLGGTRLRAPP